MSILPRNAKLILAAVYLSGLASAAMAVPTMMTQSPSQSWKLAVILLPSILMSGKKIPLGGQPGEPGVSYLSLGFILTFIGVLSLGPGGGLIVGVVGMASGCLYPRRQPWIQFLFNVALSALETAISSRIFLVINGGYDLTHLAAFPAVLSAGFVYYAINTCAVAAIMAATSGQRTYSVWRKNFVWMAPGQFAGGCIASLLVYLVGQHSLSLLLFATPLVAVIYNSFAVHVSRSEEKHMHAEGLANLYLSTIKTLSKTLALAVDAKDPYTHQHVLRVQRYAIATAQEMGLDEKEMEGVTTGALLHDIGKIGIPDSVLLKKGRLTDEEFDLIKQHPTIGAQILGPVEFPWPVLPAVKSHHEKWDGSGYPEGLQGEEIPLTARILAVADVYDALTSERSYRNAWPHEKAMAEIQRCAGSHFDPAVVVAFTIVMERSALESFEDVRPLSFTTGSDASGEKYIEPPPIEENLLAAQTHSLGEEATMPRAA